MRFRNLPQDGLTKIPEVTLPYFGKLTIQFYVVVFTVYNASLLYNWFSFGITVTGAAKLVESLVTSFQTGGRIFILIYYRQTFFKMIKQTKLFWKIQEKDPQNASKAQDLVDTVSLCTYSFAISTYFTGVFLITSAIVHEELVFYSYVPQIKYGFLMVFFVEFAVTFGTIQILITVDSFFGGICGAIASQLKLVSYLMRTGDDENLRALVKYHVLLITMSKKLRTIYAGFLVVQYGITVGSLSAPLYFEASQPFTSIDTFANLTWLFAASLQMGLYCFPAQAVQDEMESITDAAYNLDWNSSARKHLKIYVLMMTMRSQNATPFTAGGMADIGRPMFANIFNFSVSMFVLLRSLK